MGSCLVIIIEPTTGVLSLLIMYQTATPPPFLRSIEKARTARKHITREQFRTEEENNYGRAFGYDLCTKNKQGGGGGWGWGGRVVVERDGWGKKREKKH